MKEIAMQAFKKTPFYQPLRNYVTRRRQRAEFAEWERKGKPVPPPHIVKQRVLQDYAKNYSLRILVETGTYFGDMVEAMRSHFDRIYSIELSKDLYEKAMRRFERVDNVELIHGDSGVELKRIMEKITEPTLFWLDGHFSAGVTARGEKDTPIYEELRHILDAPDRGHVIIVDDARCFGADPAYPCMEVLAEFIKSRRSGLNIDVQDDSIRITPRE